MVRRGYNTALRKRKTTTMKKVNVLRRRVPMHSLPHDSVGANGSHLLLYWPGVMAEDCQILSINIISPQKIPAFLPHNHAITKVRGCMLLENIVVQGRKI